jgi:hypothetical protein
VKQSNHLWIASSLLLLAITTVVFLSSIAHAQDEAEADIAVEENTPLKDLGEDDDVKTRIELAREMHEIWPIRVKVENALERISERVEASQRVRFKAAMRQAIKFEALEQASEEAMADIFTAKELQAMIDFYGSKEGRSVSHKTADYERALEPLLVKMIDKAILDTKLGKQE